MKAKLKTTTVQAAGHVVTILESPPPHLMFLASEMQEGSDNIKLLAYTGGLLALVTKAIDGEEVEIDGKMPKTILELESVGKCFIMSVYEILGGYEAIADIAQAVMRVYGVETANPT